ncbi:MAG TPA: helix-turn-helix domain-containing protein [Bacillota bacterium]|nr:helix-turn-helix domain-containing protein [Bacillota bacterium]
MMHQHENTIRYRIFKIKELLNMVNKEIDFYAQLYLMAKIYKIIT